MKCTIVMPLAEQRGGGELMLLHLIQEGRDLGVEWQVIFLQAGPMVEQVRELGVSAEIIESGRLREPHRFMATVAKIRKHISRAKPDVIIGWMGTSHFYAGLAAMGTGTAALWYHLDVPRPDYWMDRIAIRIPAAGVLTLSKDGYAGQQSLKPHRPGRLVYPGVDTSRFDPAHLPTQAEARLKLGLPSGVPIVGIVGRLQRWKGIHTLVEAMPEILRLHPETRCIIVGGEHKLEPEYGAFVQSRIRDLNLTEQVTMVGLQHNIPEWVQAMDVFVHASDKEPFGIVIIEALALGKAVVAGEKGGPTEIITPEINGLLAPYNEPAKLATQVNRYLGDPDFARQMGIAGMTRAGEFSIRRYAEEFVRAVRELTGHEMTSPGFGTTQD